jgi:hypothetical protein
MRYWLLVLALAACDSRAKASENGIRASEKSKEYESCTASAFCVDETRCFDGVCRRTTRSAVGDYFAALGAKKKAENDIEGAIDAYNRALGHYDSEKIPLPPDVDCAYGAALAAGKQNKEHAELGARVLHRCILAVPVGSALRMKALADLATLHDAGLDPLALGRTQLADVYLSRAPSGPSVDKLTVTVTASPPVTAKTYDAIPALITGPDLKPALVNCWQNYNTATHKDAMAVGIGFKAAYIPSEYEDESGYYTLKLDPAANMPAGPDQAADACVRAALEPALKDLKTVHDAFQTKLTITVK